MADGTIDRAARVLQRNNQRFLEPGERARAGVFGNTGGTGLKDLTLIFLATDRSVYVLRGKTMLPSHATEVLEKHVRGQVAVASSGLNVRVGQRSLVQLDYVNGSRRGARFAALAAQPPLSAEAEAKILADLAHREGRRWRGHYLMGAAVAMLIAVGALLQVGLSLGLSVAVAIPAMVVMLIVRTIVDRR